MHRKMRRELIFYDFASIAEAELDLLQPCFSIFLFVVFASLFLGKKLLLDCRLGRKGLAWRGGI